MTIATTASSKVNAAIAAADNVQQLITGLKMIDPLLGQQIAGKTLASSTTPWGTIAGTIVGFAIAHYGLACTAATTLASGCWTQETVDIVTGAGTILGTLIGSYIMRWFTTAPIAGLVSVPPPVTSADPSPSIRGVGA